MSAPRANGQSRQLPPMTKLRTTAEHALEGVRGALISGYLSPGDRILQEDLAEALGVSLAPIREALAVLEQEGQVTYQPRRGYYVTEMDIDDLREIYELRALLERRAVSVSLPNIDDGAMEVIEQAAQDCIEAAERGDVAGELQANRRFHFAIFGSPDQALHTLRVIRLLWDSTETYRAVYFNAVDARHDTLDAHERILAALRRRDLDALITELDQHRNTALERLRPVIAENHKNTHAARAAD